MIFTLIAGTYTPFSLIALDDPIGRLTLILIWLAALVGTATKLWWIHAPDWLAAAIYVAAGCLIAPALPALTEALGLLPTALFVFGGCIYLIGALVFALQWPDPDPRVFGYHEIFHVCVIAAATLHFIVIAYWLVL
jgi:hemolysin III